MAQLSSHHMQSVKDQLSRLSDDELRTMFVTTSSSSSKQPQQQRQQQQQQQQQQELSLSTLLESPVSNIFELRVGQADVLRGAGNSRFREGDVNTALLLYERALKHCLMDDELMSAETLKLKEKMFAGRDPLYLNLARCYIKLGRLRDGVNAAKRVRRAIESEATEFPVAAELEFKALLLQARGSIELGEYDEAEEALQRCPDQTQGEVVQLRRACKTRAAEDSKRLRDQWRGALSSSSMPSQSPSLACSSSSSSPPSFFALVLIPALVAALVALVVAIAHYSQ